MIGKLKLPKKMTAILVYGRAPLAFFGLVCAIVVMWKQYPSFYVAGVCSLLLSMCFDLVDGWFAARFGPNEKLAFLADRIMDKVVYSTIFPLVAAGVERMSIVPNATPSTHFTLDYLPYTHGFVASVAWSALAFVVAYFILGGGRPGRVSISSVLAASVMSHWVLDLIVHTPDLLRVARKLADIASERPKDLPVEVRQLADRCAIFLRHVFQLLVVNRFLYSLLLNYLYRKMRNMLFHHQWAE